MNGSITSITTLLLLFLTASPVSAEHEGYEEYDIVRHQFFYLSGGLAAGEYLEVEDDFRRSFAPLKVKAKETVGTDLRAGYRMHRNIAAELQFQWFSPALVKVEGIDLLEVETWTFTGNLKAYLITERMEVAWHGTIHPYVVAGVGLMHFYVKDAFGAGLKGDGEDLAARFGGGIELYFHMNFGVYFDVTYIMTTGDVEGLDHVGMTVGGIFRF
ncbi:MAG: outer membrane beta-barrel protein [Myxococcales bacterium]|nr:outer membrane beta-barrel protein [Myxococcales bacterium]